MDTVIIYTLIRKHNAAQSIVKETRELPGELKEIMQGTMPGARRPGRPRTAWMDNIKTWTWLPVEELIRMTEDRDTVNRESTSIVWPTLGSRTLKNRFVVEQRSAVFVNWVLTCYAKWLIAKKEVIVLLRWMHGVNVDVQWSLSVQPDWPRRGLTNGPCDFRSTANVTGRYGDAQC